MHMLFRAFIGACAFLAAVGTASADGHGVSDGDLLQRAYAISKFQYDLNMFVIHSFNDTQLHNTSQQILKKSRGAMTRIATISKKENLPIQAVMEQDQRILLKAIRVKRGRDLKETYIVEGLKAYDDAINLYTSYNQTSDRPRLKKFAQSQLRLLKEQQSLLRWLALKRNVSL